MALLFRKKGLAVEVEATYGTDPVIAEATDSIQHANLSVTALDGDFVNRDLDRATLGAQGDVLVSSRCLIDFEVEAAGGGAVDTPPPYQDCITACGFAETINAAVDVQYDPVSSAFDSLWLEANHDGNQHIAKGARGNLSFDWSVRNIPRFRFAFTGIYVAPTAVALPTYTLSAFQVPEAFNNANTPTATLHSQSIALESISLDIQNQIEHRDIIGNEEILIVDRNVRGTISFEAPLISTKDWFATVAARTTGALQIIHGDTAGNVVQIDAPVVELSNPQYTESQGVLMLTCEMILRPNTGNDEIKFTFK